MDHDYGFFLYAFIVQASLELGLGKDIGVLAIEVALGFALHASRGHDYGAGLDGLAVALYDRFEVTHISGYRLQLGAGVNFDLRV